MFVVFMCVSNVCVYKPTPVSSSAVYGSQRFGMCSGRKKRVGGEWEALWGGVVLCNPYKQDKPGPI